jgi:protein SCO1/2
MQNRQNISTNKIVTALVFLCAAIMASVFVFHSRQQPAQLAISSDVGIIFPVARDIKSFNLLTADNQKFSQQNLLNHWTLLFFGFTHCSSVCPTTLDMMSRAYGSLHEKYPNLQVALVSLDPERDSLATLSKYTSGYHPDFIGVTGKIQELHKLQGQLGIYSEKDNANAPASGNYQIQHTSSIMLINPQGKWAGLFRFGLKPDTFAQAFVNGVGSLQQS